MEGLSTIDDFKRLRDRLATYRDPARPTIVIPAGTCGQASGANDLIRVSKHELMKRSLIDEIDLRITGCHGYCQMEPSILIEPQGTFYPSVGPDEMIRIVDALARGEVVEDLLYEDPATGERIERQQALPFFASQVRTIISRNEKVDPIRIYNYVQVGGYESFVRVLANGSREWVLNEVKLSGLRGRGGAGFPTGKKWEMLAARPGPTRYLVCNADEGDPGAYMDRSILEGNPHSVIEGMLIGAFATQASDGIIYVRHEYPLAIKHLVIALRQARDQNLLGKNILGMDFSFDIKMVRGAGAFVCGEETALIRSVEGRMGEPRQRPPYPVERGIYGKPTVINNVETWANISVIIERGAFEYSRIGTRNSAGTKVFSLVGKVRNTGLVEVPIGTPLHDVINRIGGGTSGQHLKAVQTGGPSGGCIPADRFDVPIDYESLAALGSIMGSGGMIVMDENTCMVDLARYFMNFLQDESCGKCFTCRKGTQRMAELLDDISSGRATLDHLGLLEELALVVRDTSMCGLGQSAPNPVMSTLRYFRDEFERHIVDKRCDAFVCTQLVGAPCQAACPIGTEAWRYVAHIARGELEEAYRAIRERNPFPSVCARVCDHKCESRCRLGAGGEAPVAIRMLKRFVTDNVDPARYVPASSVEPGPDAPRVAVIGSGPAGLTAAHGLSLQGHRVTVFEAEIVPGGMLIAGVPEYRLPRKVVQKEIDALIDQNITLKCNTALGRDVSLESLREEGFSAVFVAMGAHRSRKLRIEGEESEGVIPSMRFLKAWNLSGENLATGRVGVIGGGNSAIDVARVALRQPGVEAVSIYYRRTRNEMPAFASEIEEAVREGVKLETLVAPTRIDVADGRLKGVQFTRNRLGEIDSGGRRRPVVLDGSTFDVALDTLVVAIGEQTHPVGLENVSGVELSRSGQVVVDKDTMSTGLPGVFAGGDVVTGPNTVVDAIAAGWRAAKMIGRHIRGEPQRRASPRQVPKDYVAPVDVSPRELERPRRAGTPSTRLQARTGSFIEVECALATDEATREAQRCLRCDLEFTRPAVDLAVPVEAKGGRA